MRFSNYMVVDGDGNQLTAGLSPYIAKRTAQSIANDHGEPVWLCPCGLGDPGDDEPNDDETVEACDTRDGERFDPAKGSER